MCDAHGIFPVMTLATRATPTCICCGSAGRLLYSDVRDQLFGAPGVWSIRLCSNRDCGLGWLDPQPEPQEIPKLYEGYWTHGSADGQPPSPDAGLSSPAKRNVKKAAAAILFWQRRAWLSDCRYLHDLPPGRLLDVGCGMGEFAAGMAALGWTATGIEFDPETVAAARRQPGITVHEGSVEDQKFADDSFDAITMSNVIEHLPDPLGTMRELARVLRPGGRLVVITPNIQSMGHAIFGPAWRGLEPPRHLFLFSAKALERFGEAAGLSALETFTAAGAARELFEASRAILAKTGDARPVPDLERTLWRERIRLIFNQPVGEWVALVASK